MADRPDPQKSVAVSRAVDQELQTEAAQAWRNCRTGISPRAVDYRSHANTERKRDGRRSPDRPEIESAHRYVISDEELEAAAEESALSYTYQTNAYQMCCY
jgi:ribonuclease PH